MRARRFVVATLLLAPATVVGASAAHREATYLPDAAAARIVTVSTSGPAEAGITVLTEAVAIKETGPKATVKRFGEVYAFSPAFIAVHRDEPTMISFWNLQPDDEHDFMLADPRSNVLMHVTACRRSRRLPTCSPSTRKALFTFYCTMHQPAMSGQILVLPPATR